MVYTSKDMALDMICGLRRVSSECNSSTPAYMRDAVHHLELSMNKREITIDEYNLLYNDLVSIGKQFSECACIRKSSIGIKLRKVLNKYKYQVESK